MADIYTTLRDGSYLLHQTFYLPTKDGPVWAITFTTSEGTLVTAGISVALTLIFISLWKLICFVAVLYPGRKTRRRYLALALLWNSNDSWFAFSELGKYALHFMRSPPDLAYGLLFSLIAFTIWGGSLSLGIVGPSLLQIGTAAPARPSEVFYPRYGDDATTLFGYLTTLAPSFLRAIGSVEASQVTLRKRVNLRSDVDFDSPPDQLAYSYSYNYSLTGVDLGLQFGSDLRFTVNGSCRTEYGWIVNSTNKSSADEDLYHLWNRPEASVSVSIAEEAIRDVPRAIFVVHPDAQDNDRNVSFAIVVTSAHRASINQGDDPWYKTELQDKAFKSDDDTFNVTFWMKRQRPALSCWEQSTWTHKSKEVGTIDDLKAMHGLQVKQVLLDVLKDALTWPMLRTLGQASGNSALKSSAISSLGFINAEASKIVYDLERLVLASFVCTRNIFLDTTLHQASDEVENVLRDGRNEPADGAGDFVVSNPNFQTFSMVGLIMLFVVLFVLWIVQLVIHTIHRLHTDGKKAEECKGRMMLFKALPAAQLFRRIYEPKEKDEVDAQWECAANFPSEEDETMFKWVKCGREDVHCKGHIDGEPAEIAKITVKVKRPGLATMREHTSQGTGGTLVDAGNTPQVIETKNEVQNEGNSP